MNKKLLLVAITLMATLSMIVVPALAEPQVSETSTEILGATTVTWDSSFLDSDYTLGSDLSITVSWTVDAGEAQFAGFVLKTNKKGKGGFTPRSKKDPATGTFAVENVSYPGTSGDNSVDFVVAFTDLHLDKDRNVEIGNAHFKLYLLVDEDGNDTLETEAGFGVNVHVEDPQD